MEIADIAPRIAAIDRRLEICVRCRPPRTIGEIRLHGEVSGPGVDLDRVCDRDRDRRGDRLVEKVHGCTPFVR
jgi:hypothetical protein